MQVGGAIPGAQFVDPAVLARIGNLELLAKTVVDGFINGLHRSPYFGASVDFAEHRGYMPGDDIRRVPVADPVMRYALSLVRTSRPKAKNAPDSVKKWVAFGASVRAAQYLVLAAKARALMSGRYHVTFDDIRSLAHPVLRHRVLTNFHAESEGITSDSIIDQLLEAVPTPRSGM